MVSFNVFTYTKMSTNTIVSFLLPAAKSDDSRTGHSSRVNE